MTSVDTQEAPLVELKFDRPPATVLKSAQNALSTAQAYSFDSVEMYEMAASDLQQVMGLQKSVEAQRTAITGPLNQATKAVNDLFRAPAEFLKQAEKILKDGMLAFQRAEERRRIEEQQRLQRIADAERARIAEEAAAAQAIADKESQRLRDEAAAAQQAGDAEAAARLASQAQAAQNEGAATAAVLEQTSQLMSAPIAAPAAPKISGVSNRKVWTYRITDPSLIPREYLVIDEKKIGGVVRALQQAANIPGVEVFQESSIASRAA